MKLLPTLAAAFAFWWLVLRKPEVKRAAGVIPPDWGTTGGNVDLNYADTGGGSQLRPPPWANTPGASNGNSAGQLAGNLVMQSSGY